MRVGQISDPDIISNGYYVHPSVVVGLSPQSPLVCDEQFGPLIPILPYDSLEEAIAAVNSTDFGLGGSVWSSDVNHAFAIASRFKSGVVFVNSHGRLGQMPHAPFGGLKESGYGRESGDAGLLEYVQDQSVFLPSSAKR
jgi:acyl-CoA reductase-like NAD-dependent aldehyde dehydrogenase